MTANIQSDLNFDRTLFIWQRFTLLVVHCMLISLRKTTCLSFCGHFTGIWRTRNVVIVLVRMTSLQDSTQLTTAYSALVPCNQDQNLSSCDVCCMLIATNIVNRMFTKREAKKINSKLEEKCIRAPKICGGSQHRLRILVRVLSLG